MSVGYVGDTEFVHFNNEAVNPRFEPQVPWIEQIGQKYCDNQTCIAKVAERQIRVHFQKWRLLQPEPEQ